VSEGLLFYLTLVAVQTALHEWRRFQLSRPTPVEPPKQSSQPRGGERQEQRRVSTTLWWVPQPNSPN